MGEIRNKFILGGCALVFFSMAYAFTLNTDASLITGTFATEMLTEQTTAWAIVILMALAGGLAGYFTFARRNKPKKLKKI